MLLLFFLFTGLISYAQDYKTVSDSSGMPSFFPPEEGVRGGFDPVTDKDIFNPYLFYSQSKQLGEGFSSIKARRKFYRQVHDSLGGSCRWFRAACIVTGPNSLGAAERFNFWLLNKRACNFMKQGNAYLFIFNRNVATQLMESGKVNRIFVTAYFTDSSRKEIYIYEKKERALDESLVLFEQTLVQYYIDIYRQQHPGLDMNKAFRSINRAMHLPFAPKAVRKAIKARFSKKHRFHFQSFDDRVALGLGLIEYLYRHP
ncbi:MAG: hypothetical protein QM687_09975 [Ferruginibacter sp.]